MNRIVLSAALSALVTFTGICSASDYEWPPDASWVREAITETDTTRAAFAEGRLLLRTESEHDIARTAEAIVLGCVVSLRAYTAYNSHGVSMERLAITIEVDRCIRGDCTQSEVVTSVPADRVDESSGPGSEDIAPLQVGTSYIFFLFATPLAETRFVGGRPNKRMEVADGVIVRKGIPAEEFIALLEHEEALRDPRVLIDESDAVVLGRIGDILSKHRPVVASEFGNSPNYVELRVEQVLRGNVSSQLLRVPLPWNLYPTPVRDQLSPGSRVCVFLNQSEGSSWSLVNGYESIFSVDKDGQLKGKIAISELRGKSSNR